LPPARAAGSGEPSSLSLGPSGFFRLNAVILSYSRENFQREPDPWLSQFVWWAS
jgi:hypothetical protein